MQPDKKDTGPTWGPPGPIGPGWAPCWPHEQVDSPHKGPVIPKAFRYHDVLMDLPALSTFPGSTSGVSCMELSTDGQVLVTGSRDCSVDVWQVSSPALLFRNR